MKRVIKVILAIFLIPVLVVLKLIEWLCSLAQLLSGWLFRLLGFIFLLTAAGCWMFHLEGPNEVIRMAIAGAVVFMLPIIGDVIIAVDMVLEVMVKRAISI